MATDKEIIRQAMALMGKSRSSAKALAARENGKLGGRPRKPARKAKGR